LDNEPAVFEISDSPDVLGDGPWYAVHKAGYLAVLLYNDIIELEARRQGVDPDLVKAMVYTENANGALYGPAAQAVHLERSTLPMNIRPNLWSQLAGEKADLRDPLQNIEAGVRLLGRIMDRLKDPSVAKVATLYNSLAKEQVTELGARTAEVYETRAWEKVPGGIAPRTRAAIERRRQSLIRRLE
jgi:soluble lytic murein transglycosylase-like protein